MNLEKYFNIAEWQLIDWNLNIDDDRLLKLVLIKGNKKIIMILTHQDFYFSSGKIVHCSGFEKGATLYGFHILKDASLVQYENIGKEKKDKNWFHFTARCHTSKGKVQIEGILSCRDYNLNDFSWKIYYFKNKKAKAYYCSMYGRIS